MNYKEKNYILLRLRIGCRSEESFPASSLKFYINDEIANDKNVRNGKSRFTDDNGMCIFFVVCITKISQT